MYTLDSHSPVSWSHKANIRPNYDKGTKALWWVFKSSSETTLNTRGTKPKELKSCEHHNAVAMMTTTWLPCDIHSRLRFAYKRQPATSTLYTTNCTEPHKIWLDKQCIKANACYSSLFWQVHKIDSLSSSAEPLCLHFIWPNYFQDQKKKAQR